MSAFHEIRETREREKKGFCVIFLLLKKDISHETHAIVEIL